MRTKEQLLHQIHEERVRIQVKTELWDEMAEDIKNSHHNIDILIDEYIKPEGADQEQVRPQGKYICRDCGQGFAREVPATDQEQESGHFNCPKCGSNNTDFRRVITEENVGVVD